MFLSAPYLLPVAISATQLWVAAVTGFREHTILMLLSKTSGRKHLYADYKDIHQGATSISCIS